jgi:hypothetical protein
MKSERLELSADPAAPEAKGHKLPMRHESVLPLGQCRETFQTFGTHVVRNVWDVRFSPP